jgi:hypothetical protein
MCLWEEATQKKSTLWTSISQSQRICQKDTGLLSQLGLKSQ